MIETPKIKYRKGIIELNPKNLFDVKDFDDAEEHFYTSMLDVRREKNLFKRIHFFIFSMSLTMGDWITWNYLLELLEFLDLKIKDIEDYISHSKKIGFWKNDSIQCRWYLELKENKLR